MAFPASAIFSLTSPVFSRSSISNSLLPSQTNPTTFCSSEYYSKPFSSYTSQHSCRHYSSCFRISYRFSDAGEGEDEAEDCSFDEAVVLFNTREYYKCHDFLESLWNKAEEPTRTLFHGILQCAVGFHHLFNQNHKGAMMELGEGLCKLRKMNFKTGPFYEFEQQISAALDFIYQTQIELAACGDDVCVAMDRSERSYQLLGRYAAGQLLYTLQLQADDDPNETMYIVFHPRMSYGGEPQKFVYNAQVIIWLQFRMVFTTNQSTKELSNHRSEYVARTLTHHQSSTQQPTAHQHANFLSNFKFAFLQGFQPNEESTVDRKF